MGWQDRDYYRGPRGGMNNPLMFLMTGSVPLFTAFGIRVRMHVTLLILIVLVLLFGLGMGFTWQDRVLSMSVLFTIILLHEFGHCFAARWVGGEAEDILMWPLGGLAMARPPHRPWPTFVTVAGGPLVNVIICLICGLALYFAFGWVPWNPFEMRAETFGQWKGWLYWGRYALWIYFTSWSLLLFNLLPIFPLDGGQLLQSILWPKFGYYRSMNFACITGMIGAVVGGMIALATLNLWLVILAISGFMTCLNMRRGLLAAGPWGVQELDGPDYSSSLYDNEPRRKRLSKRSIKKAQRREAEERAEQERVDAILAKVSAQGMNSLTWWEKRTLRKATERQRKRDLDLKEEMTRKGF